MENFSPGQFEFLIRGDVELSMEQFNTLMVPQSFPVNKEERDGWIYFKSGGDEFFYSWEPPGIQMIFNWEAAFQKAKSIAEEVVQNLRGAGFDVELLILDNSRLTSFQ